MNTPGPMDDAASLPAGSGAMETATSLRAAGRTPAVPLRVQLADGRVLTLHSLLRVLPGKRIVGAAELEGGAGSAGHRVLAKLFIAPASARHWQRECDGIAALLAAGIPTPALVARTELAGGGHVVLTDFLDGADSLDAHWQAVATLPPGDAAALAVLAPAFAMLGRLHAHGLVQDDLHLGNFLVHAGGLWVIDGDAVRALTPGQALDADAASANFAILAAQLPAHWDGQLPALLQAWADGAAGLPALDPAHLQARIAATRDARLRAFLAKTRRDCTLFQVTQTRARFSVVLRERADELAALVADPDRAMAQGTVLKDGNTCTVARSELAGPPVVIKRYNIKGTGHALSRALRPSRAAHAWVAGHRLQFIGIATPAPLALIEARHGPLRRHAWLITAYCGGTALGKQLADRIDAPQPVPEAQALVTLFDTLQRARLTHGDLKASNLLWQDGQLVLIDLDALQHHRSALTFARAWRSDRARLLRNWPAGSALHAWLDAHLPGA